jgi:hypothetical protein
MHANRWIAASVLWLGCAARPTESEPALVYLQGIPSAGGYRLTLVPAPGAKINARLPPVLELEGGRRVQFDQTLLTPDSAYFAAPPGATLERAGPHLKGVLRVGVCPAGLNLCRALQIPIDTTLAGGN